jgi:hypothetical protein
MSLKVSDGIDYTVKLVNINVIDPLRINKISDHNGNVFRDNDYIPFYTFYKYSPKKNERNTMCLFLENEHNPKFEFKVVGDKDLIKFDKSNDTNKRINEKVNEFVISPANINSKEYLLELIIKDDGNQIIKKIIKMQIRTPSKLSIFYNYSNLAAYLPSVSGKSNFYSNKFGVSYRFKKFISVSPSLGFVSGLVEKDTNFIKLGKLDLRVSLNQHLFPETEYLGNIMLKELWFSYPYLNSKGENEYFHSIGFGAEANMNFYTSKTCNFGLLINFNYYPAIKNNNFSNVNKFAMYEIGFGWIINPYKRIRGN